MGRDDRERARLAQRKNAALKSMERHIDELPLLPQVLVRILQLNPAQDDYFEQFEELATQDPAFTVRIVALANSAASSPADTICTIRDALTRMGTDAVSELVASLSVQRVFMPSDPTQVRLWQHSIETAVASRHIARLAPGLEIDPGRAYLLGLLHDIGRFVMLEHAAPELLKVDESEWRTPEGLVQADLEVYTYTHSQLGYLACLHWGLPAEIASVVRNHHDEAPASITPGSRDADLFCVQVADRISMVVLDTPGDDEEPSDDELEDVIRSDCLRSAQGESALPAPALRAAIGRIREDSARLVGGLGFG